MASGAVGRGDVGAEQLAQRLLRPAELPGAIDVRMAFYGDVFESPNVQGGSADPALLSPAETSGVEELAAALLVRAALAAGSARDRTLAADELARLSGTIGEEQGVGNAARAALVALARLRWFAPFGFGAAQRFVVRSLVQVTRYLTEPGIRESVQARVADLLGEDTVVLVGHSLGSIVAFEAACRLPREGAAGPDAAAGAHSMKYNRVSCSARTSARRSQLGWWSLQPDQRFPRLGRRTIP